LAPEDQKTKRATLIDVARLAGVSRATASLVIRNSPLVAKSTRVLVEEAIESLGYIRNLTAARLRAAQTRVVGLVVPNLTNPFFTKLLAGVEEVLEAEGLAVLLANSHDSEGRQNNVMRRMREHGVDGFLVCPAVDSSPSAIEMCGGHVATVQVLRYVTRHIDYVGADYRSGMEQAVSHLAALGHQRIAFAVQGGQHSAYHERFDGFGSAMSRFDLDPTIVVGLPSTLPEISQSAHLIVEDARSPTATICFNDLVAFGLSGGFQDLDIKVGSQHSILGFDDVMQGEPVRPRLTSVATYPTEIGRRAAKQLLLRLQEPKSPSSYFAMQTDLHIRQSTGPLSI
jgi:LacI family transcriptional regulator